MAWELLTKVWKLDPTRLHVTCFEGDEKNGVPRDDEAAESVEGDRRHCPTITSTTSAKDNFWEMGDTGPCGPCTEIYIDRTPDKIAAAKLVNGEDPRVMEIWNNVFIQYNRNPDRSLTPLPAQHVDTGMGFERICQVLQDMDDNYAIDLFDPFFDALTEAERHQVRRTVSDDQRAGPGRRSGRSAAAARHRVSRDRRSHAQSDVRDHRRRGPEQRRAAATCCAESFAARCASGGSSSSCASRSCTSSCRSSSTRWAMRFRS